MSGHEASFGYQLSFLVLTEVPLCRGIVTGPHVVIDGIDFWVSLHRSLILISLNFRPYNSTAPTIAADFIPNWTLKFAFRRMLTNRPDMTVSYVASNSPAFLGEYNEDLGNAPKRCPCISVLC